jgi:homeobox protein cut-like
MKLFLDDENAVHKLVASQYKIAPEKLMRTGSFSASREYNCFPLALAAHELISASLADLAPHSKMPKLAEFPPRSLAPDAAPLSPLMRFGSQPLNVPAAPDAASAALFDPLALHRKLLSQKVHALSAAGPLPPQPIVPQQISPSLYEMAALTHELDTQAVTTKVKEILLANNVGQKVRHLHCPARFSK